MKRLFPWFLALTSSVLAQQSGATTKGTCSPATSGNGNTITINCGISEAQGAQLVKVLNKILAKGLDPTLVLSRLDDIAKDTEALRLYGAPTHGVLLPGNQKDPSVRSDCGGPGGYKIFLGGGVARGSGLPVTALQGGKNNFVKIASRGTGISVDASATGPDGKIIVQIRDNQFVANPNNTLDGKLSNDGTTLEVTDEYGRNALKVEFLSSHAIRISGRFISSGGQPLIVEEDHLEFGTNQVTGPCAAFGPNGVAFVF